MKKKEQKKKGALLTSVLLCVAMLTGCAGAANTSKLPVGAAENEIIAYQPVDENKTMITMRTEYNGAPDDMESIIEKQFPEVDIVPRLHATAGDQEFASCLKNGDLEDLLVSWGVDSLDNALISEKLVDLSSKDFTSNYYTTSLNACQRDGRIYYLPGPSKINGIVYDKTLFAEHQWQVPTSLDSFIQLCQTIKAETGLTPVDFTFKHPSGLSTAMNAWSYSSVLAGNENYQWLQDYAEGNASMTGHMEPMFDLFKQLLDAGVITEASFTREPGDRSTALYKEYTAAMTNETQMAPEYAKQAGSDHEYGMMPYWGSNDPNSDYVAIESTYNFAVNKKLEAAEHKEKYNKVMEIVKWLSSVEGQQALIGEQGLAISNVKDVPVVNNDFTQNVAATIEKGHLAPRTYYSRVKDSKAFYKTMHQGFWNIAKGTQTAEDVMKDCDAKIQELLHAPVEAPETVYGTAEKSFSRLETGLYIADAFRRTANTDIGLVLVGEASFGTMGRIYAGDVTEPVLEEIGLDTIESKNPDFNKLAVTTLTGDQILQILKTSFNDDHQDQDKFTCYLTSGLKVEYAPWASPGEHLVSVKNEDGSDIDPDKTYTVAYWNGSLSKEKSWNAMDTPLILPDVVPEKLYEESFVDLLKPVVQEDGKIIPFTDGRLTLNWERVAE